MNPKRWVAVARGALLVAAVLFSGVYVASSRAVSIGESALLQAEAAFDRGNLRASIDGARRAAAMRVPWARHADAAFARLIVIAHGAEERGDAAVAIEAWEAVRGAALESRVPFSELGDHLSSANQNLARLRAEGVRPAERREGVRSIERDLLLGLTSTPEPTGLRTTLIALGFALAVGGCIWAALRGISKGGEVRKRELLLGATLLSVGVACWTFAVTLA